LTVYSAIRFAGPDLQTTISQGMRTGTVPTWTAEDTHSAPGAITVTWCTGPHQRDEDYAEIVPHLAAAFDLVVTADLTTDRWLNGTTPNQIEPVDPAFAGAYLNYARQLTPTLTTEAHNRLERKYTAPEAARCTGADGTGSSTRTTTIETVERLAIASARLEHSETVTPAHVETAGRLSANTGHEIEKKAHT
jgi:DNA replicative helicase MCM subunit Mcm2 (Cdc46/Mcm family)